MTLSRRSFPDATLAKIRALPLRDALERLGLHCAVDRDFTPVKDAGTARWYVTDPAGRGQTFELLVTGAKWFDSRSQRGGGGAIDLAMHLTGKSFVDVVKRLV